MNTGVLDRTMILNNACTKQESGHPQGMPLQWYEHALQAHPSIVGASLVGALTAEPLPLICHGQHVPIQSFDALYGVVHDVTLQTYPTRYRSADDIRSLV